MQPHSSHYFSVSLSPTVQPWLWLKLLFNGGLGISGMEKIIWNINVLSELSKSIKLSVYFSLLNELIHADLQVWKHDLHILSTVPIHHTKIKFLLNWSQFSVITTVCVLDMLMILTFIWSSWFCHVIIKCVCVLSQSLLICLFMSTLSSRGSSCHPTSFTQTLIRRPKCGE